MSWGPTGGYVGGQEPKEKFDREDRTPANFRTFKTLAKKPKRRKPINTMNTGDNMGIGVGGLL